MNILFFTKIHNEIVFRSLCVDWGLLSVADDIPVLDNERSNARILSWASLSDASALKALSSAFWALSSVALKFVTMDINPLHFLIFSH